MNQPIEHLRELNRIRLIGLALEHLQLEGIASAVIPIPGGDRVIAIGTPAQVAKLLGDDPHLLTTNGVDPQNWQKWRSKPTRSIAKAATMIERPILFSGPMVRALLDGTKTQTRRVIKRQPWASCSIEEGNDGESPFVYSALHGAGPGHDVDESRTQCICPYGQTGDRLWVRETWAQPAALDPGPTFYRADYPACADGFTNLPPVDEITWKPSIHMFRKDSRILLEITGVRVERLQDISEADAAAEGWPRRPEVSDDPQVHADAARDWYMDLWEQINGAGSWDANPWVWVVEFRRIGR